MRWIIRRNRTHKFEREQLSGWSADDLSRAVRLDRRSGAFSALSRLQLRCFVHKILERTSRATRKVAPAYTGTAH
jgi:hypothetical protein